MELLCKFVIALAFFYSISSPMIIMAFSNTDWIKIMASSLTFVNALIMLASFGWISENHKLKIQLMNRDDLIERKETSVSET